MRKGNCTVTQNVPRQHNQCPLRYKTQYHPVSTLCSYGAQKTAMQQDPAEIWSKEQKLLSVLQLLYHFKSAFSI